MKKSLSLKGIGAWLFVLGAVIAIIIAAIVAAYYFGGI
jgi:hypothetical protein